VGWCPGLPGSCSVPAMDMVTAVDCKNDATTVGTVTYADRDASIPGRRAPGRRIHGPQRPRSHRSRPTASGGVLRPPPGSRPWSRELRGTGHGIGGRESGYRLRRCHPNRDHGSIGPPRGTVQTRSARSRSARHWGAGRRRRSGRMRPLGVCTRDPATPTGRSEGLAGIPSHGTGPSGGQVGVFTMTSTPLTR
jgi:hypothetical protein